MFNIVLFEPEIPPNTGNIMRLAVNSGCVVHLIKPLGFSIDDKQLKRAGLDYMSKATYVIHDNFASFLSYCTPKRLFLCSTKANTKYTNVNYQPKDTFVFGPETRGLPTTLLDNYKEENKIYIPMKANGRSLNLATAVAIIVYEAWRQIDFL
jgi:tRNA (cytidine/uridine-2'-O-)-methyltransferase